MTKTTSQPQYKIKVQKDVPIIMPDGVRLYVDIYRPDAKGKFPALLSLSPYGKEVQTLTKPSDINDYETVARGWNMVEAGNTDYFVSRGYVHVVADSRGSATSEGKYSGQKEAEDGYNIIEWMAEQPWCTGNIGMLGMSWYAMTSFKIAQLNPPHLKAICPVEALTDLYRHMLYHGGILHYGFLQGFAPAHTIEESKGFSTSELSDKINILKRNKDIRAYPALFRTLISPKINPYLLTVLLHPFDGPNWRFGSAYSGFDKIKIPCYIMCRWTAWPLHLRGAFQAYEMLSTTKKLRIYTTPSPVQYPSLTGPQRPWHENHDHVLRWYDHWLKGIDTGIMDEPPIQLYIQGINQWRDEFEWPLARTKWNKYFLRSNGFLENVHPLPGEPPDVFTNKPWLQMAEEVPCIKYTTSPLTEDLEVTGPIALYFYALLNYEDANWMVDIKDISPSGEERIVTKGWLKASHREIDKAKSKPYKPFHPHTKQLAIQPGKVYEYAIDICETSNVFRVGHRIQLVIKGQDSRWEEGDHYFHLNNMNETKHYIYHSEEYPSYLLLPTIPK